MAVVDARGFFENPSRAGSIEQGVEVPDSGAVGVDAASNALQLPEVPQAEQLVPDSRVAV